MSQLHFAQLSDTHIRKDYSVGLLSGMFTSLLSPDEKRQEAVYSSHSIAKEQRDFVMEFKNKVWEKVYNRMKSLEKYCLSFKANPLILL